MNTMKILKHNMAGLSLLFITSCLSAQTWQWAKGATGPGGDDEAHAVSFDASGNVYVVGRNQDSLDFGTTQITHGSGFIVKYDSNGNLLWVDAPYCTSYCYFDDITTDENGNSYVAGGFRDTLQIGSFQLISPGGGTDVLVAAYDSTGSCLWARNFGGNNWDHGRSVTRDAGNNVYVTGIFADSMTVGTNTLVSNGNNDVYVMKLDNTGTPLWATSAGSSRGDEGKAIALDGSGNVIITGAFQDTITFGSSTLISQSSNYYYTNGFIAKLDNAGNFLWGVGALSSGYTGANDVVINSSDEMIVSGGCNGDTLLLGSSSVIDTTGRIFVAKLDASGTPVWLRSYGNGTSGGAMVAIDNGDNWYLATQFSDTLNMESNTLISSGSSDILLAKFDASDANTWITQGGGTSAEVDFNVNVSTTGTICVVGTFDDSTKFGSTPIIYGSVPHDALVTVIDGGYVGRQEFTQNRYAVSVYPNPATSSFSVACNSSNWSFRLYDITGRKVMETNDIPSSTATFSSAALDDGTYIFKIVTNDFEQNGKLIIK